MEDEGICKVRADEKVRGREVGEAFDGRCLRRESGPGEQTTMIRSEKVARHLDRRVEEMTEKRTTPSTRV